MCFSQRNFTDCDVIEIETYERLLSTKKNDLQAKVNAAIAEACDEIQAIQSQLNELIESDPRVSLEILNKNIEACRLESSSKQTSITAKRENLAFFGLKPKVPTQVTKLNAQAIPMSNITDSSSTSSVQFQVGLGPRFCRLLRENQMSGWGFAVESRRNHEGMYISRIKDVKSDGAAKRAGIEENDEILEINNISVTGLGLKQIVGIVKKVNTLYLNVLIRKT